MAEVNNPYTFNITEDMAVSAIIVVDVPTGKFDIKSPQSKIEIMIPQGVTVVKVTNDMIGGIHYVGVTANKKYVLDEIDTTEEGSPSYYSARLSRTIRTPNWFPEENYPNWETWEPTVLNSTFFVEYSAEINTHTPDVMDY